MSKKYICEGEGGMVINLWEANNVFKRKHNMPYCIEHSMYETLDTFLFNNKTEIFQYYHISSLPERPNSFLCLRKNRKFIFADGK